MAQSTSTPSRRVCVHCRPVAAHHLSFSVPAILPRRQRRDPCQCRSIAATTSRSVCAPSQLSRCARRRPVPRPPGRQCRVTCQSRSVSASSASPLSICTPGQLSRCPRAPSFPSFSRPPGRHGRDTRQCRSISAISASPGGGVSDPHDLCGSHSASSVADSPAS